LKLSAHLQGQSASFFVIQFQPCWLVIFHMATATSLFCNIIVTHTHTITRRQSHTHTHHNRTTTHARMQKRTGWLAPTFKGAFSGANPERSPILFIISWWGSVNMIDI
jgi:hypothetical protein